MTDLNYAIFANKRHALAICELGVKNQKLISACLDHGMLIQTARLLQIDRKLWNQFLQFKMLGDAVYYVWHTQEDGKVRAAHAANDGKIFAWSNRPATGHPGEDYGCRCWAEPLGSKLYAMQTLISASSDAPYKWTNKDLVAHFRAGSGEGVSLSQIGYLKDVIVHYSDTLGIYERVEKQVIKAALFAAEGSFSYSFDNSYDFGNVLYSLGESTVRGEFVGEARIEQDNLIINGEVEYYFIDQFTDPGQLVEIIDMIPSVTRQDAENFIGTSGDVGGKAYPITGEWQTKFNATVR